MARSRSLNRQESDEAIEFGMLPELIGYQLRVAQIAIFRDFDRVLGRYDITPTLFGALVLIEANSGLKQTELAQAIQLDRSTVVSVIDNLEGRGLVARTRSLDDRRSNSLSLTPKGRSLLATLRPLVVEHEERLARNLRKQEQATLVRALKKIFPEFR